MVDMEIGIAILCSVIVIFIVIRLANPRIKQRGQKVIFEDTTAQPWSTPAPAPAPTAIVEPAPRKDATNFHSVTVAVYIPLMLSLVSGLIASLLTLFVMKIWWSWLDALTGAGISFVLVVAIVWVWRLMDWQKLIHQIEMISRVDINGDGNIGADDEPTHFITINHYDQAGNYTGATRAELTLTQSECDALSNAILVQHKAFSESALARGDTRIMSQKRFAKIQDDFIRAHLIESKGVGNTSGYEFNRDGLDYLSNFLPSPTAESIHLSVPVR